jgi:hypothetical protein
MLPNKAEKLNPKNINIVEYIEKGLTLGIKSTGKRKRVTTKFIAIT